MRLFPSPYDGLHPAFPPPEDTPSSPAPSGHPSFGIAAKAGLVPIIPLVIGAIVRRPSVRAFSFELSAYSFLGLSLSGLNTKTEADGTVRAFLASQGVEVPTAKPIDRLGHFDFDDALILGGASGIYVASLARRPWSISGWKRWLGAAAFGKRFTKGMQEKAIWALVINKTVLALAEQKLQRTGVIIPSVAQFSLLDHSLGSAKDRGRDKIGVGESSWPNHSDGPHLTIPLDGEVEPVPYANTNYTWFAPEVRAVPELEAHIERLRQLRQNLAQEAEVLWHWLARKEAEFYDILSRSSPNSDVAVAARRYVETLAVVHTHVWVEVSKCDWMIASARKRIEQLQSAHSNAEGKVSWMPPAISAPVSASTPERSLIMLKAYAQQIEARRVARTRVKTQVTEELTLIEKRKELDKMIPDPATGRQTTLRQSIQSILKDIEDGIETAKLDAEVVGQVIADGEKHASVET